MAGLYFEQFSVGQTFVHEIRRTVTDMDNILFSSLTYNPAAVHIDHEYAKGTEFAPTPSAFFHPALTRARGSMFTHFTPDLVAILNIPRLQTLPNSFKILR